ncbi:PEP/pyruvate-binding domain-containing protein [Methanosalsum natronophilum]|nr:PEP/pyruvate-binding domain-containing protein [Methanosalsum natronophilum]MCS3923163.1 hypothetical protein [Methanosalsum natronophilum]
MKKDIDGNIDIANYGDKASITTGIQQMDHILHYLRLGDNVVWKIESIGDYKYFATSFIKSGIENGYKCVYVRFAPHDPILEPMDGLDIINVEPSYGFDYFSSQVHRIIKSYGKKVFYVFDNLSSLVVEWATDELVANFFKVTCPYLFELDTIGYFALSRGRHTHTTVAAIRDTTQVLIDFYHIKDQAYVHPLKVYARYSQSMFLPHAVTDSSEWKPVFESGAAASISSSDREKVLHRSTTATAPWDSVYTRLKMYYEIGDLKEELHPEIHALKKELSRMIIGDHPKFNDLADIYLSFEDLLSIRDRIIGSGRIGGKAVGMLLARNIVLKNNKEDISEIIEPHDSFYIGSDVFFSFMINNNLFRLKLKLSDSSGMTKNEFFEVEKKFLEGDFSTDIIEQFKDMLEYFGQAPIIIRSSSLQEDSYGNAFAGKYRSEFCANQGSPEDRLSSFINAVKLVYASALNPDALSYRRSRGLQYEDEQMAILVQRVSGLRYNHFFFPSLAGVTFSKNMFTWTNRIDPSKGVIRLVFGLGTRAVDRVGRDYPRMIAVSHPTLRPETGIQIQKYSQWDVDVIDLKNNRLTTIPFHKLLSKKDYPNLKMFVSCLNNGYIEDPYMGKIECESRKMILTFNNLIKKTSFVKKIDTILETVEQVYEKPVDIEFTSHVDNRGDIKINIVQCRPMTIPGITDDTTLPKNIPEKNILFQSSMVINAGKIDNINYILYIDPESYETIDSFDKKRSLGRVVGLINSILAKIEKQFILIGPGRWGSSNIELGVNVTYSEIDNTSVLVEMSRIKEGHTPEVSYGTHFFQDLVESGIVYMPLYPDQEDSLFNETFFYESKNVLTELLPEYKEFENIVKLIDISLEKNNSQISVIANQQAQKAIVFLKNNE